MKSNQNNNLSGNRLAMKSGANQYGYSLIEVMIAAFLLSFSILGIASLQMIGMKGTQQSMMKQQAMSVVHNMIERMRVNQAGVIAGDYVLDSSTFDCTQTLPNCTTSDCSSSEIALLDQLNIVCGYGSSPSTGAVKVTNVKDNAILVEGTLQVTCVDCSKGDVALSVGWVEREFGKEEVNVPQSLTLNTRIAAP